MLNSLSWLIRLRWLAGISVLAGTLVATRVLALSLPEIPLYLLGCGLLAYNAALRRGLGWLNVHLPDSDLAYQWFARLQIGLDWACMAVLIHLTGGIESQLRVFFLFHITIASLLLPHDRGFLYVTLAPVLVGGIAVLEYYEILPHIQVIGPPRYKDIASVSGIIFSFTCACYVMAYLSMSISRQLRRREDEISGLYRSVRAVTSTLDSQQVLKRITETTAQVLRCKAASIRLLDETASHLTRVAAHGLSEAFLERAPLDLGRVLTDQETLRGETVLVRDALGDSRLSDQERDKIRAEGIGTILSAPLMGKRGPIGVLRAYGGEGHQFTTDDAAFLGTVARQSTVAIENAQTYETLENLNRDKSQFARIVSHELRSPVQVTQNLLTLLAKGYVGALDDKQAELVDRVLRRIQFLQSLVDDLLDLAAGKIEVLGAADRGPVPIRDVLTEISRRFETQANAKGLQFLLDCPANNLTVWGDRNELDRIMNNLIGNAVKYTARGEVRVVVKSEGEFARISVADTGIGIPGDALPHLFEEFFRAKNAKASQATGTGLGLAIVKDLIRRYDGTIDVESVEGQGTTFTLRLPVARREPAARSLS